MSDSDEHRSLEALDRKLAEAEAKHVEQAGPANRGPNKSSRGMAMGLRISVEMVASIVVGTLIGLFLDEAFGTGPLMLIVFVFLGAAAGAMNAYRSAKGADDAIGFGRAMDESQRRRDDAGRDQE